MLTAVSMTEYILAVWSDFHFVIVVWVFRMSQQEAKKRRWLEIFLFPDDSKSDSYTVAVAYLRNDMG